MPEDNERIEDFMTLWKNKNEQNNNPSAIGNTLNQMEVLKKENQDLRNKISENIVLISKTEDLIKNLSTEKERLRVEKEEALMDLTLRVSNLEKENLELGKKVSSMVKLLLEKDNEIKRLESIGVTNPSEKHAIQVLVSSFLYLKERYPQMYLETITIDNIIMDCVNEMPS